MMIPYYRLDLICQNVEAVPHSKGYGVAALEGTDAEEVIFRTRAMGWHLDLKTKIATCPLCRSGALQLGAKRGKP